MDTQDKQEILEAINASSSIVQEQLDSMSGRLDSMSGRLDSMSGRLDSMSGRLDSVEECMATKQDLRRFEQKVIDKMSEGFADLEGTLVTSLRKEDNKVNLILDILERHKVAPIDEIERVRSIHLFPQSPEVS